MISKQDVKTQMLKKIANMQLSGVPVNAIAKVMQVTDGAISQITTRDDYKEVKLAVFEEQYRQQKEIDEGWDGLEHRAVKGLADNMKWNADPEFALRVAAVANKAQRRGGINRGNQPLNADVGQQVQISLSKIYVNQITVGDEQREQISTTLDQPTTDADSQQLQTLEAPTRQPEIESVKIADTLSKSAVEKLFGKGEGADNTTAVISRNVQASLDHMFNGVLPELANA